MKRQWGISSHTSELMNSMYIIGVKKSQLVVQQVLHVGYVLVNVTAARQYWRYSEAVDYTGRGRSSRPVYY